MMQLVLKCNTKKPRMVNSFSINKILKETQKHFHGKNQDNKVWISQKKNRNKIRVINRKPVNEFNILSMERKLWQLSEKGLESFEYK